MESLEHALRWHRAMMPLFDAPLPAVFAIRVRSVMETYLDPAEWPRWFHHVELESVLCETPEDVEDLPGGYRKQPFSEDEKYSHAKAEEAKAQRGHKAQVARIEEELDEPVRVRAKTATPKVPYRRPTRAKVPYGRG